jgi:hypothetical protein
MRSILVAGMIGYVAAGGCRGANTNNDPTGGKAMTISVTSTAFEAGKPIPKKYSGEGQDLSPPLAWSNLPQGTKEIALICDDPDAPTSEPWVHWVLYKLPAETAGLPEGLPPNRTLTAPAGAAQGVNSFGKPGYGGPMPPKGHGMHHYRFRVYALDKPVTAPPGVDKKALLAEIRDHVLAQGELVGTYER